MTREDLFRVVQKNFNLLDNEKEDYRRYQLAMVVLFIAMCLTAVPMIGWLIEYVRGIRCFVPNKSLIWEATRPIFDYIFCESVDRPLILPNLTRDEFKVSK